jgi:hypothetical protein
VRDARTWAGGAHAGPELFTRSAEPPTPVLPRALLAAGLRVAGLHETEFLSRPNRFARPADSSLWLHGPDERLPWAGPALGLHLLRLLSVACGLAAVLGAHALARRLCPRRPGVALLAAGLLAFSPVFLVASAGLGGAALATALTTWSLVALADLARGAPASTPRSWCTGGLLALAFLAGTPALALLPLAPLAVLLGRARGTGRRAALRPLDTVAAGFLVVAGPFLAWHWVAGELHASAAAPAPASLTFVSGLFGRGLARLAFGLVAAPAPRLVAGPAVLLAWSTLAGLGVLGLLVTAWRARRGAESPDGRVAWLLSAAVAAHLLGLLIEGPLPVSGRELLPVSGALAALLAAGCGAWIPAARPRLALAAGALTLASLAAAAADHEARELGPAFHPLNRVNDPRLLCFDPLAAVPDARRLATIRVLQPHDGEERDAPPELRWEPVDDPDTRYSVHVLTPGAAFAIRTFESTGVSVRDRWQVPDDVWEHLPPGVDLVLRAVRLPWLREALADEPLIVDETLPVRVRCRVATSPAGN